MYEEISLYDTPYASDNLRLIRKHPESTINKRYKKKFSHLSHGFMLWKIWFKQKKICAHGPNEEPRMSLGISKKYKGAESYVIILYF